MKLNNEPPGLLNALDVAIIGCNQHGLVTYLNVMAEALTGLNATGAFGKPVSNIIGIGFERQIKDFYDKLAPKQPIPSLLSSPLTGEIMLGNKKLKVLGSMVPIFDMEKNCTGFAVTFYQMYKSNDYAEELYYRANYDSLTGLPNKFLLFERLQFGISLARRQTSRIALLFIDLDGFKLINDTMGHLAGDKLLQSVARRLTSSIRTSDSIGRYGGDEFLILLNEVASQKDCEQVSRKIIRDLNLPHSINNKSLSINASIGISIFPGDADNKESLVDHADKAMYLAKKNGRNRFEFYK